MRKTEQEIALESFNEWHNFKCDMRIKYGYEWPKKINSEDDRKYKMLYENIKWEKL